MERRSSLFFSLVLRALVIGGLFFPFGFVRADGGGISEKLRRVCSEIESLISSHKIDGKKTLERCKEVLEKLNRKSEQIRFFIKEVDKLARKAQSWKLCIAYKTVEVESTEFKSRCFRQFLDKRRREVERKAKSYGECKADNIKKTATATVVAGAVCVGISILSSVFSPAVLAACTAAAATVGGTTYYLKKDSCKFELSKEEIERCERETKNYKVKLLKEKRLDFGIDYCKNIKFSDKSLN